MPLTLWACEISAFVTCISSMFCPGMKNMPATFQHLMNSVIQGLSNTVTYIDDVVTFSETWEDHVNQV